MCDRRLFTDKQTLEFYSFYCNGTKFFVPVFCLRLNLIVNAVWRFQLKCVYGFTTQCMHSVEVCKMP